jgi:hypothetical protein
MRVSASWAWAGIWGAALGVGCGDSKGTGNAADFVGTWSCTVAVAGTASMETIVVVENADGTISATGQQGAGLSCALRYDPNGDTATLAGAQTCSYNGSTITVTGGTASVSGATLSANLDVSETVGGITASATGSYTCAKQ